MLHVNELRRESQTPSQITENRLFVNTSKMTFTLAGRYGELRLKVYAKLKSRSRFDYRRKTANVKQNVVLILYNATTK